MLITHDTADALYIEPIKSLALSKEGVVTLLYALKRAIENVFQAESNEIGAEMMGGGDTPNIFLYEASEGSLGILSQFIEDKAVFRTVVEEAIKICNYDDPEYKDEASYKDLLDYDNQRYHDVINRFEIKDALEKLRVCDVEIITSSSGRSYDEQYQRLLTEIDSNSSTEQKFIDYLYKHGLRLPMRRRKELVRFILSPISFTNPTFMYSATAPPTMSLKHRNETEKSDRRSETRANRCLSITIKTILKKSSQSEATFSSRSDRKLWNSRQVLLFGYATGIGSCFHLMRKSLYS